MKKKILLLPIEIYRREFYVRLYLALIAVARGYQVVIGEVNTIKRMGYKNGILLYKDHANWTEDYFNYYIDNNFKITVHDEEGLIVGDEELYRCFRASASILKRADAVFLWGENQFSVIKKKVKTKINSHIVGSPKFDISTLERLRNNKNGRASRIKYVLVNTRFSYTNGIYGDNEDVDVLKGLGIIRSKKDIDDYNVFLESEAAIFNEFIDFIRVLSEFKNIEITIRPHPVERIGVYLDLCNGRSNVKVDGDADLRVQMLEHDCVVHDGCTTGIEALSLGIPVFGLRPKNLPNPYDNTANKFSLNFTSSNDLASYIIDHDVKNYEIVNVDLFAKHMIQNWGDGESASYSMMKIIDELNVSPQKKVEHNFLSFMDARSILYNIINGSKVINFMAKLFAGRERISSFIRRRNTVHEKFPDLDLDRVRLDVATLCQLDCNLHDASKINMEIVHPKVMVLYLGAES